MPVADFGQSINISGGQFVRLKSKGDKLQFRFAKGAVYEGKHFLEQDGKTTISFCPRIMTQGEEKCTYCEKFFQLNKEAKEAPADQIESLKKEARKYNAKISFYYPILDRADGKSKILQTTLSIRNKLEAFVEAGINVLDSEFIMVRTETSPADYYSLIRVDSKDVKKITDEEKAELEKAKELDIAEILGHDAKKSGLELQEEVE